MFTKGLWVKFQAYTQPDVFDDLREEWNALLHRSQVDRIFLTVEWQQTWWEAYHPGDLWVITGRTDDGDLMGIAPWFVQYRPEQRVVRAVGCVDVTDYLEVIVAPEYEAVFFSALVSYIASAEDVYDKLDLCNIPQNSPTLTYLPAALEECCFEVTVKRQEVCPIVQLPADWDTYLAALNKKQRHELRRKLRRAGGPRTEVDWYIVGPEHDLEAELDQFLQLMAASGEEKAAFLQDAQNVAFFRAMTPLMMAQGWLQLNVLTVNGEAAAAYLNFDYNNRILVYNSGQDSERFGQLSPGIVLLAHNIRHAIDNGREVFDFLRGNEPDKYQMGGQDTEVFMLIARRT
jgi:CelD/BcsL family acetyltransferase involved in cellulose biosynthesis